MTRYDVVGQRGPGGDLRDPQQDLPGELLGGPGRSDEAQGLRGAGLLAAAIF